MLFIICFPILVLLGRFPISILGPIVSLISIEKNDLDLEVYCRIASFLIAQASSCHRITFLVMGHPCIYVFVTELIRRHAPQYNVAVRILPAVSAIDTILALMDFDISNTGLQILDANRIVSYALTPAKNVPLLIFQVGCFGSGFITRTTQNSPDRIRVLVEYLMRFYPADHPVEVIECDMGAPHRTVRFTLPLASLCWNGNLINYNTTLYLPPAEAIRIKNSEFHRRLVDPNVVAKLTLGSSQ